MIYFHDDFNFPPDNFPALFGWLKKGRLAFDFDRGRPDLKRRWGDYRHDFPAPAAAPADEILSESYRGHNLYDIYEQELLFFCASTPQWPDLDPPAGREDLVRYLAPLYPEAFGLCRRAALHWIDHWRRELPGRVRAGLGFGGSLIYAQAFARVLAAEGLPSLMLEHFFTGHDFYLERRLEPLPNDSLLRNNDYCRELARRDPGPLNRHLKLQRARNKNVRQPAFKMPSSSGYALILGQVPNDFSILSRTNPFKNSVGFYKKAIDLLLERSGLELIVKTHPYEARKARPGQPGTGRLLGQYLAGKPAGQRRRVSLVENQSLAGLISRAAFALTLNSQAGLETLLQGRPLLCFGRPFYGDKGFTRDLAGLEQLDPEILSGGLTLPAGQYENFLSFLDAAFEHLIGTGEEDKVDAVLGPVSAYARPKPPKTAALTGFRNGLQALGRAARGLTGRLAGKAE